MSAPRPAPVTAAVAVLSLAVFMSGLDLFIVNLAFPSITADYPGTTLTWLSWVLNGYTIVFAAVLVPAGRWADRIGRRRVFAAGLTTFTVGSALCGLAPSVGLLIAARVVQAIGAGMMVPTSLSLLLAVVPLADRARAIGTWSAVGALGAGLGPVVGGLLLQASWRWVFWVNLPVGILALLLVPRALPESRDPQAGPRPDVLGAILLALSVAALALGLVKGPTWGWTSARPPLLFAAAAVGFAAVWARSLQHPAPVVEPPLLRLRSFSGAFVASLLYYAGFSALVLNTVEFLTTEWHYSALRAGLAIAPGPLCVLPFARIVAPRLAARFGGPGRIAVIGCLVSATGQGLMLALLQSRPSYVAHLLVPQLIGGVGVGLTIPSLLTAGMASVPAGWFGVGSGVLNMARQVGAVIGVAALVAILSGVRSLDALVSFRSAIELLIGFFAAAALIAAGSLSRGPVHSAERGNDEVLAAIST